jgi:hypothetical protein
MSQMSDKDDSGSGRSEARHTRILEASRPVLADLVHVTTVPSISSTVSRCLQRNPVVPHPQGYHHEREHALEHALIQTRMFPTERAR